eukprot:1160000-Pelagomonas_calceolata.AAC.2
MLSVGSQVVCRSKGCRRLASAVSLVERGRMIGSAYTTMACSELDQVCSCDKACPYDDGLQ